MTEWKPIETAPKDGKPILGGKLWMTGWVDCHTVCWSADFGFCQLGGDERDPRPWQPTHWMPCYPLPTPAPIEGVET